LYARGVTPEQEQRRLRARELHARGMSYAQIGRELQVSRPTAKKYCLGLGLPDNSESVRGRGESRRNPRNSGLASVERRVQAFDVILSGRSVADAASQIGADRRTVQRWVDEEIEQRVSPRAEKLRALGNARLDQYRAWAWEIAENATGELRLKALDRLLHIERRWAALNGADSPVRVDAILTERTQADLEMEELLRELDARNAVIEGEIVDDAAADPA